MSQSTEGALPPTSGPVPAASAALGAPAAPWRLPGAGTGRGVIPLRPLLVGEILDGAVTVMRSFPGTVFGVTAVVVVLGQAVSAPLDYLYLRFLSGVADSSSSSSSGLDVAALGAVKPGSLITLLTQTVLLGLLVTTVSRAVLGRTAAPGEVWAQARPRVPRLLGMTLLMYLVLGGALAAGLAPGVVLIENGQDGGPLLLFLGFAGAVVFCLWRGVAWSLAGAALMLEDQPVRAAFRRSSVLVRGSWWRVLGVRLAATLVAALVTLALTAAQQHLLGSRLSPEVVNADGTVSGHPVGWGAVLLAAAFTAAVQIVVTPFAVNVTALQYLDQRMRREALDIQLTRRGGAAANTGNAGNAGNAGNSGSAGSMVSHAGGGATA
jgi:hypothetical protein